MLENCACDSSVRFVLTVRNLLDMVVSRMAYHHWTCTDTTSAAAAANTTTTTGEISAASAPSLAIKPSSSARASLLQTRGSVLSTRCGGQDPSCCWRKDARDVVQVKRM